MVFVIDNKNEPWSMSFAITLAAPAIFAEIALAPHPHPISTTVLLANKYLLSKINLKQKDTNGN